MARRFEVSSIFKSVDKMTTPVRRMGRNVITTSARMERAFAGVDRGVDRVSRSMRSAGRTGAVAIGATAVATKKLVDTGADFEQTLVNAAAKFPGEIRRGTDAFIELSDAARQVGRTTEFTASQAAEGLNFLAFAGFDAQQAMAALPGTVDLATAAQIDLGTATDIATDSLGAFGLMTKDAIKLQENLTRINDVMAKTTTTSNTNMEMLFETIKDGAPVATTAGASVETFAALAGVLANSGIKASRAGTTLKNVFVRLTAQTPEAAKVLARLGVATKDSEGNFLDVIDIIEQLNTSLADFGTADRSAVLESIFGRIPLAGVNVLLQEGAEGLRNYRSTLEEATGASRTMASVMRDTTSGSMKALASAIESVTISTFDLEGNAIKGVIDRTTEWVRANEKLISQRIADFIDFIITNADELWASFKTGLKIFAAIIVLSFTLKTILAAITIVSATTRAAMLAYSAVPIVMKAVVAGFALMKAGAIALNSVLVTNPFVLIIAGIVAFIAYSLLVIKNWDAVKGFFVDLWQSIPSTFKSGIDAVMSFLSPLFNVISALFNVEIVRIFWDGFVSMAQSAIDKVLAFISPVTDAFGAIFDGISSIGSSIGSFFGGDDKDDSGKADVQPQVVSPQERISREIQETTSDATVTIRDETGRAEVDKPQFGIGSRLNLVNSGSF